MQFFEVRAIIADVFLQNGFTRWAQQTASESCESQLKRLAIRAINTTPEPARNAARNRLITLLE